MTKRRNKWKVAAITLGVVALVPISVYAIGAALPAEHQARVRCSVSASQDEVWRAITTPEEMPDWRPDVESVRVTAGEGSLPRWVETGEFGDIPLQVIEMEPPSLLVTRIDDPSLPFGGTWTYLLESSGETTDLILTEDGIVSSPVFRFFSRFVFGHTSTMESYCGSLQAKFKEDSSGA